MRKSGGLALIRRIGRRVEALGRRARRSHRVAFGALMLVQLLISIACLAWSTFVPASFLIVPLVVGGVLLRFGELVALTAITTTFGAYVVLSRGLALPRIGFVLVLAVVGWIMITSAKVRSRLGVPGTRGPHWTWHDSRAGRRLHRRGVRQR